MAGIKEDKTTKNGRAREIAPGITWLPISFVNVYFVGEQDGAWILVDTGIPGSAGRIRAAAEERYGAGARPRAIVLTHGHFDHASSAAKLSNEWDVPIYAHRLELPYLTGKSGYPPPDPTIGGFIAQLSRTMPAGPRTVQADIHELPPDGIVPAMADWRWLETLGHSPGHISLFRDDDKALLAGDAVATANMDSFIGMLTKKQELARAGAPFNTDWQATRRSAQQLAQLQPSLVAAGHGIPMANPDMPQLFETFAAHFPVPTHGRYVAEPAITDETGVVSLPPRPPDPVPKIAAVVGVAALAALMLRRRK